MGVGAWISLWVRPRATIRRILDAGPRRGIRGIMVLGWTAGVPLGLALSTWGDVVPAPLLPLAIGAALLLGAILALVVLYLHASLLRLVGRLFEGRGDALSLRTVVAWCQGALSVWRLLLLPPWLVVLGDRAFHFEFDLETLLDPRIGVMLMIESVLGLWQLVVFLKCVAEAHRFSTWRALGVIAMEVLVVLAPVAVIVLAVLSLR